jgi:hypothetical protein
MVTNQGRFLNNENFCSMIENLGDAYEAAAECFGMVQWLASRLESITGVPRADWVRQAEANYAAGLRLGGVQRPR